jgi:two-component system phosphate regulon sensor histidine kinase PhoR
MSNKIFKAIWIVAITVFLASLFFIMGISYNYLSLVQKDQLRSETELAARGLELAGKEYFEDLKAEAYRITWVASDGTVMYDSDVDPARMENHLNREEIKEALETGYGEAQRYSSTLADRQLYAAKRLPDGSVLRLSIAHLAVWTLLLGVAQPIFFVILVALVLSFVLAYRLTKKIIEPINRIDLSNPSQYYDKENYKEIEPLLRHISAQQKQLKKGQAQIERTALIRQEFTANVSHELKTPLHAISGYAELLENGMVKTEDIKPFAGKIRGESLRMTRLVEDIMDLAILDSGGEEMTWENCDFYRIAENAIDSLGFAAAAMNVSINLSGESAPIYGVPQMLYSIIYNLCDNAIKYNRSGGNIHVSLGKDVRDVVLTVKDDGIGIPESSQDRIFERFYRVDKSRSKGVGGTGLGLSIVKHAVLIHGGSIKVHSRPGEGSEFIVTMPTTKKSAYT